MRYAEFREQLESALREEGLFFHGADRRVEMIDLEDTVRHWTVHVQGATPINAEPAASGVTGASPRSKTFGDLRIS